AYGAGAEPLRRRRSDLAIEGVGGEGHALEREVQVERLHPGVLIPVTGDAIEPEDAAEIEPARRHPAHGEDTRAARSHDHLADARCLRDAIVDGGELEVVIG